MAEKLKEKEDGYESRSVYFRNASLVTRLDDFAQILPDCTLSKLISNVMERAIEQMEKKDFIRTRTHEITISVTL